MSCTDGPTRHFVHELIDWGRIDSRRRRYPAIAKSFPEEVLRRHWDKPPYYCHGMAWRLGTWSDWSEATFARLNQLLCLAGSIPNWENEESVLGMPDYGTFWSVIWQLQVAEHLCRIGAGVRWGEASGGPDLSVKIGGERWFVECYSIQKSYGLLSFLEELLSNTLDVSAQTEYQRFLRRPVPTGNRAARLLDELLEPLCDPRYREKACRSEVTIVCKASSSNPCIRLTGKDEYVPNTDPSGSPREHVKRMLAESVRNKKQKNQLDQHRPNILAVNLLLTDTQIASSLRQNVIQEMAPNLEDTTIDVLATAKGVGIDKTVGTQLRVAACRSDRWRRRAKWIEADTSYPSAMLAPQAPTGAFDGGKAHEGA